MIEDHVLSTYFMNPLVPKEAYKPRADKDFAIIMQEYAILPNIKVPNSMNMEFNWLTFNGKSGPANTPLIVRHGERVRIRLINLGMDHHPIHLHGHQFVVTGTEGGRQPQSTWGPAVLYSLESHSLAMWNSLPAIPATGRCTAIFLTT
jgi:FtsP/CotA-like multicopper oxidase with cupredoxin domain